MLRIRNLSKAFAGQVLLRRADWFVGPQAHVALVGANGSGKSTLLQLVAGRETPDDGQIEYPKGLRLGYLAQTGFELGTGTVREEARRGFDEIVQLQTELAEVEARLESPEHDGALLERALRRQSVILDRLAILGAHDVDRQIHAVLAGLGFAEADFDRPLSELSGGWQMRAALGRILLGRPQLLLLDEPTNHLDLEAREWLEGCLRAYPCAFILVSHDRYFLDVTVNRITEITGKGLEEYTGNYTAYEKERAKRVVQRQQAYERQQDEIRRMERFIERFRYKNTKAAQVQSRVKRLAKLERLEPPESAGRGIIIPQPTSPRAGKIVLEVKGVRKSYGDLTVFRDVDLRIVRGSRVALVGPNGAGKSTLMRLLANLEPPDEGEWIRGHNVAPAFFAQDHGARLDPQQTVHACVKAIAPNDFIPQVRGLLGAFLFSGVAVDKLVAVLSGGERNRLALARLLVRPSNLLLLDEPTNHLDITAKDVLLQALREYGGTIVFVSHDRHFLEALADHIVEIGSGGVREYPGNYEAFLWRRRREAAQAEVPELEICAAQSTPPAARPVRRRERNAARRVGEIEREITTLEERKSRFNGVMGSPDFFANQAKAATYLKQFKQVEDQLAALYREWERLLEE